MQYYCTLNRLQYNVNITFTHSKKPKNLGDSVYCDICGLELDLYSSNFFFNMLKKKIVLVSNGFYYHNKIISTSENANKNILKVAH